MSHDKITSRADQQVMKRKSLIYCPSKAVGVTSFVTESEIIDNIIS